MASQHIVPRPSNDGIDVWMDGWKESAYWLDGLEPPATLVDQGALPPTVDVAIVGSGYTGLNAAIEIARGGRSCLVLDAHEPGFGCSTRNGGQISTSVKPSLAKLSAQYGMDKARAIRAEGERALSWIEERIKTEAIECAFERCGRFHAAHTPSHYEELARSAETMAKLEAVEVDAVTRAEQRRELGSDAYHGGVVFHRHAALHPARYLHGLLASATAAGAQIKGHCAVTTIERLGQGFDVITAQGRVRARNVIVATNGYTSALTTWLQRRVIPIGSYIIATETLPITLMDELFPTGRIASDTCKVVYYYRPSPDRQRVLFGGRVSATETDPAVSGPKLYADMCRIFPQLAGYRISHSWTGTVAYSFDEMAHIGVQNGLHYALGYCGSGVSMASYLGMRIGQQVLGLSEGRTAFDGLAFPTRPLYTGRPWFLPAVVAFYRWQDRYQYQKGARAA